MSDLLHFDPLTDLSALRDAMRQLLDDGWLGPRDLLPAALASVLVPVDVLDTGPDLVDTDTASYCEEGCIQFVDFPMYDDLPCSGEYYGYETVNSAGIVKCLCCR